MEQPETCLGYQFRNLIVDRSEGLYILEEKYVRGAVENFEKNVAKSNQQLLTCCKTPIMSGYRPETDTSPELKSEGVEQYQYMFGYSGGQLSWCGLISSLRRRLFLLTLLYLAGDISNRYSTFSVTSR